ncbi:MAG: phosphohistidine phosphatase SixA [bacterium]
MDCMLYLMRHGIAAEPAVGINDAHRALTDEGVRKTTRVAVGLKRLDMELDGILSSPYRRAEETARLVADVLDNNLAVELYPPLAAGAAPQDILKCLNPTGRVNRLLLVGHQPDLGDLASYVLTGSASRASLPFKKAAVAAISLDSLPPRNPGLLEWFLTPGQLRCIGEGIK